MNFFTRFDSPKPAKLTPPEPPNTLNELETRIDRICHALGIDPVRIGGRASDVSSIPPHILDEVRSGRKIQAIKEYREMTGIGLREAKDAIEAIERGDLPEGMAGTTTLYAKLDAILAKVESDR